MQSLKGQNDGVLSGLPMFFLKNRRIAFKKYAAKLAAGLKALKLSAALLPHIDF